MDWQTPIALIIVLAALAGVVRGLWGMFRKPSVGCGSSCAKCPSTKTEDAPLISLQGLSERKSG